MLADHIQIFFILLFAAVLLIGLAQKFYIPYPIALVVGGTILGFTPGLHPAKFDPNLILLIVLPPILYYASFGIAFREFRKNWRDIFSLALGLVIFTTIVIAIIFKWMFPQFSWALAFAFGAIVSPPDAIAATTILKRFAISPTLISKLEGESLINDASALILYKMAVVALLSGSFSFVEGGLDFIYGVCGGIALGFVLGLLFQLFSKHYLEPALGVVFSFTIPYVTYIIAGFLGVSGVLAVVVNGLIGSRVILTHHSSLRRVLGYAAWDIFSILMNSFVFVLIGLQLRSIIKTMTIEQMALYSGYALFIVLSMIIVRMFWIYLNAGIHYINAIYHSKENLCPKIINEAAVIGWSGMRGIVSLAAAFALPFTLPNGSPLQGRDEVIFITFVVILITLVIPGLSLPFLIRWLDIQHIEKKDEVEKIRKQLTHVAEEKLQHLHHSNIIDDSEYLFLKSYFISQTYVLERSHQSETQIQSFELARLHVTQSQRKKLLEMWKQGEIDDHHFNHFENALDVTEVHIARGELK